MDEKNNNKDLNFLKEFSTITVASVCKEEKIDSGNMYKRGKNADKVKSAIDKKLIKLYNNYVDAGDDNE